MKPVKAKWIALIIYPAEAYLLYRKGNKYFKRFVKRENLNTINIRLWRLGYRTTVMSVGDPIDIHYDLPKRRS
jgi:hypothetical protein